MRAGRWLQAVLERITYANEVSAQPFGGARCCGGFIAQHVGRAVSPSATTAAGDEPREMWLETRKDCADAAAQEHPEYVLAAS